MPVHKADLWRHPLSVGDNPPTSHDTAVDTANETHLLLCARRFQNTVQPYKPDTLQALKPVAHWLGACLRL